MLAYIRDAKLVIAVKTTKLDANATMYASKKNLSVTYNATSIIITPDGYNQQFINRIKANVPSHLRVWDHSHKRWIFHPTTYRIISNMLENLRQMGFNVIIEQAEFFANASNYVPVIKEETLDIHYIGRVYRRNNSEESAYGWYNDGWNVVFINNALQDYFKVSTTSVDATNYYNALIVNETATHDQIKRAYRVVVKQWHPDICSEPNAREQFEIIQKAYETLISPDKRARYDLGLKLERDFNLLASKGKINNTNYDTNEVVFNPMIKCGRFTVRSERIIGRVYVHQILDIDSITNASGQVMTTTWKEGDSVFTTRWV